MFYDAHPPRVPAADALERGAARLMTGQQKSKRKRPRWGSTVPLPSARAVTRQTGPRLYVLLPDGPHVVETLVGIDPHEMRSVRRFQSRWNARHAPQRPYMATMGRHIEVESLTESVHAQLLDRDTTVDVIVPQPFWIERGATQRPGWAAPDFLAVYKDGRPAVIEVKAARDGLSDATVGRLRQVAASCAQVGLPYEVRTALDVRQQQLFEVLQTYRSDRVLGGSVTPDLLDTVLHAAEDPVSLATLWELGPEPQIRSLVWWMIWHNRLCLDWTAVITEATLVRAHQPARCVTAKGNGPLDFTCGPRLQDRLPDFLATP